MKNLSLLFLALFFSMPLFSQDLIVTIENDSIACKINEIVHENIYFSYSENNKLKRSILPLNMVKSYHYKYYSNTIKSEKDFSGYRIAIQGGYGFILGKADASQGQWLVDVEKKLNRGFNVAAAISYYFTPNLGIGINGSFFTSNASVSLMDSLKNSFTFNEKVKFYYIAPHFASTIPVYKGSVIMNASVGFIYYHNKILSPIFTEIKKPNIGAAVDIGYDFNLSENFALGIMGSVFFSSFKINEINTDNGVEPLGNAAYRSTIIRIDLTLGLRFK